MLAAIAVVACPIVAVFGSNSEAVAIPAYLAVVFISLLGLSRRSKGKDRAIWVGVWAWTLRLLSVPMMVGFGVVVFVLSPINNKLFASYSTGDSILAYVWNGLLVLLVIAFWWALHRELSLITKDEKDANHSPEPTVAVH